MAPLHILTALKGSAATRLRSNGRDQRSQTRSPREGPMQPANNRKNQDFYEILVILPILSKKTQSFK